MQEQLRKEKLLYKVSGKKEILIESSIFGTNELYTQIKAIAEVNLPSINGYHNINDLIEKNNFYREYKYRSKKWIMRMIITC